jgi:hypothetical protein
MVNKRVRVLARVLTRGKTMKRYVFALAAAAVMTFAGFAWGQEAPTTASKPVPMTDTQLDHVTAGGTVTVPVAGLQQNVGDGGQSSHRNANNGFEHSNQRGACFTCLF